MKQPTTHKFRAYQYDMYRYGRSRKHFSLFADMRMGKTTVARRIVTSYKKSENRLVLVVAPFSTWDGWQKELTSSGLNCTFIDGTQKQRLKILSNASSGWFIINYEAQRSKPIAIAMRDNDWDVVVLDESDMIKNPKSKVSKFFTDNFRFVKHRAILTGTPDAESDLDFYQQIKFVDDTIFNEKSFWAFRRVWCEAQGYKIVLRKALRQRFRELLAKHCFFIKRSDVNMGGEQIVQKRFVRFDAKTAKIYQTLEEEFILESKEDSVFKSTTEAFATFSWARLLASGIMDGKCQWTGKLEELHYLLSTQLKGEPVVVWACFDTELYSIEEFLNAHKIACKLLNGKLSREGRDAVKDEFQAAKFQVLIAQPEIFKYGTDLSVASTIIYYSLPASAKTYRQSRDRTTNLQKTNSCLIILLLTEATIDEDLATGLEVKLDRSHSNHSFARMVYNNMKARIKGAHTNGR